MRWGPWTWRGRGAGGKFRAAGVGVCATCVKGAIGQGATGGKRRLIFLEGGDDSAARWKTGWAEEDGRRSTGRRRLRFSVRAPIAVRSRPEHEEESQSRSIPWTDLLLHRLKLEKREEERRARNGRRRKKNPRNLLRGQKGRKGKGRGDRDFPSTFFFLEK